MSTATAPSPEIALFAELVSRYPDHELYRFSLAKALFDSGRHAEAATHFEAALEKKPEWMAAAILAGKCRVALGQNAEAKLLLERALALAEAQHHDGPHEEVAAILQNL